MLVEAEKIAIPIELGGGLLNFQVSNLPFQSEKAGVLPPALSTKRCMQGLSSATRLFIAGSSMH
jgi:hypothetical protein